MTAEELKALGWTVVGVSLYDEEGIEGWTWWSPDDADEITVIGDWDDAPPVPGDIEEHLDAWRERELEATTVREELRLDALRDDG